MNLPGCSGNLSLEYNLIVLASAAFQHIIQPAGWRDLPRVRRLQQICFRTDAYDWLTLLGLLMSPRAVNLKAMAGPCIVGFVSGEHNRFDQCGWIITIGVQPEYTGQGIGAALLAAAEAQLAVSCMRLTVRTSNQRAIRLYEHTGYVRHSLRSRYYADGEDGWIMEKSGAQRV